MTRNSVRFVFSLLIALLVMAGAVGPASAKSADPYQFEEAHVFMQDGWRASGRHAAADDFVVVCPVKEVLDPSHPCSESYRRIVSFDDLVLVCPATEVLDPSHPCASRRAQIAHATADDYVLVCPIQEVLDPTHPCAEQNAGLAQGKIPGDYVMTCPVKEVLEPGHPCAKRSH